MAEVRIVDASGAALPQGVDPPVERSVVLSPGQRVDVASAGGAPPDLRRSGDDLVIAFADGSSLRIDGFFTVHGAQVAVDGAVVAASPVPRNDAPPGERADDPVPLPASMPAPSSAPPLTVADADSDVDRAPDQWPRPDPSTDAPGMPGTSDRSTPARAAGPSRAHDGPERADELLSAQAAGDEPIAAAPTAGSGGPPAPPPYLGLRAHAAHDVLEPVDFAAAGFGLSGFSAGGSQTVFVFLPSVPVFVPGTPPPDPDFQLEVPDDAVQTTLLDNLPLEGIRVVPATSFDHPLQVEVTTDRGTLLLQTPAPITLMSSADAHTLSFSGTVSAINAALGDIELRAVQAGEATIAVDVSDLGVFDGVVRDAAAAFRVDVDADVHLTVLDGRNGFQMRGRDGGDYTGAAVAVVGDVNGDGLDDVAIGAFGTDIGARDAAGATWIALGAASGFSATRSIAAYGTGGRGWQIQGADAHDVSGIAVAGAGDVDGDGIADLIVGAFGGDPAGRFRAGESWVLLGGGDPVDGPVSLSEVDRGDGFRIDGASPLDESGFSVAGAGDVDRDGFDDVIVGAPYAAGPAGPFAGAAYLVFGGPGRALADVDLASLDGGDGLRIDGAASSDVAGFAVAGAGDVNGDGRDDLLIGAPRADGPNGVDAGAAYVVFGTSRSPGAVDLAALDGGDGFRLDGAGAAAFAGAAVAAAGDVNGDGFGDIVVGGFQSAAPDGTPVGAAYVVFGSAGPFDPAIDLATLDGSTGFRILGADPSGAAGFAVSGIGDFNADGYDDVLVGAPDAGTGYRGEAFVVLGRGDGFAATVLASELDGGNGFAVLGRYGNGAAGGAVAGGGDVDGDGYRDLVIGEPGADPTSGSQPYAGAAYVLFGQDVLGVVDFAGGPGDDTAAGTAAAERLVGGLGNDVLAGGGGADVLVGGAGDDVLAIADPGFLRVDGGTGTDTLRLDASTGMVLDFSRLDGMGGRVRGIERVDLSAGDNTVRLDLGDLLALPDAGPLTLFASGPGDAVDADLAGHGFTTTSVDGFSVYADVHGFERLVVEDTIDQGGIIV